MHMLRTFLLSMPLHTMFIPCHSYDMNIPFDLAIAHHGIPLPFIWYEPSFWLCHYTLFFLCHSYDMEIPFDHAIAQHGLPLPFIWYEHSFWLCHYTPCSSVAIHLIWKFLLIMPLHSMVLPCHADAMDTTSDHPITQWGLLMLKIQEIGSPKIKK